MWSTRSTPIKIAVAVAASVGTLAFAGCSNDEMSNNATPGASGSSATVQASAEFNDADVTFVQGMYPHHAQAVEMANLVEGRTSNAQIVELAKAIEAAQAPEMEQMAALLQAWGKPAPSSDMGGMDGGSGMSAMSGMMSQQQMTDLAAKSGADFDTTWLNMMIEHHTGAIEMAEIELADGDNAEAKQLATDIIAAQQAEIATMKPLLQQN